MVKIKKYSSVNFVHFKLNDLRYSFKKSDLSCNVIKLIFYQTNCLIMLLMGQNKHYFKYLKVKLMLLVVINN